MTQISLTFPDGNARSYDAGVTPAEVAASIATSLAKKAISATVMVSIGTLRGLSRQMPPSRSTH